MRKYISIINKVWLWIFLLAILCPVTASAQNSYPVHVSVQALPPYGIYLRDYYSGTRDKLIVTLLNRDKDRRTLQVKLRVQIKNGSMFSLRSRDELYYPMITLESGIPLRLTSADLAAYLAPEKITMQGYLNQGKLPTGMTEFSVQAVDYITGRTLSEYGTGRVWLEIKQPPTLNMPLKDEQVAYKDPQHIRFQWMPRHQGLANTMYEFVLKLLPDNGVAPQSAFAYGQEIYRTQTRFTTLNYTHLEPMLMPGSRYAWQVRAIAKDGIDEIGMFDNNGYSEIGWFELNDNCPAVTNVKATGGYRKMTIEWKGTPQQREFFVEYRPKSSQDFYDWTSTRTFDTSFTAYQLNPGWTYEYRVGAICMKDKPVYSPIGEITLSENNEAIIENCGVPPIIDLSNQTPKEDLKVGDVVIVGGDHPMTITELSSQGNGWYSGKGKMHLAWIFDINIAMKFNRLRINTDNRQIDGTAESETDPKAAQIKNTNELDYGGTRTTAGKVEFAVKKVDFTVPETPVAQYDTETEELIVFDTEGKPHVVETKKNEGESIFPMVIEDKQGNKYQIDAPPADDTSIQPGGDGTGSGGSKQQPVISKIEDAPSGFDPSKLAADADFSVRFLPGNGKYAFDAGREPWYQTAQLIKEHYRRLENDYIAPWKLIPVGENDVVEAVIAGNGADKKKIKFALKDGNGMPAREENGKWIITLPAVKSGETYEVFAIYEEKKGKPQTVGKLNVVSYSKQKHTVTLVPVDGATPDISWLETQLNNIFTPYGVTITVKVDESLKGDTSWDLDGDGALNLNGSGFFSKETNEMKALRKLYQKTSPKYDRNAYYIFLSQRAKAGEEPDAGLAVQGDMPRGKQFGYIFMQNSANTPRLIAHELGHGIFTLLHTFDVNYSGNKFKSATTNLMDYNDGTELAVWQWNIMAKPAPLTWFDNEDDAKSVESNNNKRNALLQQLIKLGPGYACFALRCNSQAKNESYYWRIENYRYYLFKVNSSSDGTISPEIIDLKADKIETSFDSRIPPLNTPTDEAFLVQAISENGNTVLKACAVDINDYPRACEADNPLNIEGFNKQLQKDLHSCQPPVITNNSDFSIDDITSAVQEKLDNAFFKDVKLCVDITTSTGAQRTLQTTGLNRCEDAEIKIKVDIDEATGQVGVSINPSESYLSEYILEVQKEADARGIKVNVEDLRNQIINDLKSKERSRSLFDKLTDQLPESVRKIVKNRVATFVEGVQASQKICKNVWDKGEINKSTWYSKDSDHQQWPGYCQFHPVVGGLEDGVIDEIVGIPLAIKGVYEIMTDEQQRQALKGLFSAEGMSQMWESLKTEATETLSDNERTEHFGSKTVVQVASTLTGGVGKLGSIMTAGKTVAVGILPTKITKFVDKLRKVEKYAKGKYARIPDRIEDLFKGISPETLNKMINVPGFDKVLDDMAQHWGKFYGGKFQIEYAARLLEQGKKIRFEVNNLSDNLKRIYDIVIDGEQGVTRMLVQNLELKNWKQLYSETIKKQFIQKDLVKMKELGEIQWVFKKTAENAFTPESLRKEIIETLKKVDMKEELSKLFDEEDIFKKKISATFKAEIEDVDDLIDAIEKPDIFNKIFKITE
ncbi:hypothetical protein [Bacteroides sp.]